jgi:phage terminase small subunit
MEHNTDPSFVIPLIGVHTNKAVKIKKGRQYRLSQKTQQALDSGDVQAVIDSLSERQRLFCEEYLKDLNAGNAVLRSGYNTNNPKQMGSEILTNPAVRITIDALRAERSKNSDVTKDYVLRKIVRTLEKAEADNNHTAVLRASELLAKHLGMFIERQEISGPDGEAIKYEKTVEDATDFTNSIASLAKRAKSN